MNPLAAYLDELRGIRSTGAVPETAYYPALSNLLNEVGKGLKPGVRCVINVRDQGAGIPDGGFFAADQPRSDSDLGARLERGQIPERGVMEAKGIVEDVRSVARSDQVRRYWERYGQVLVTNLWDFVLVGQDADGGLALLEGYSLAESRDAFLASSPQAIAREHGGRFEEYLKRVLLHAPRLTAPRDVAWFLASYARDALVRVEKRADLPALDEVRSALESALGLKFEGERGEHFFRSTLVQTLFYGVFSAWVLWSKQHPPTSRARFSWREAEWSLRVPMIRALFEQLNTPSKLGPLGLVEVLDWTGAALNRVDRASFFASFEEGKAVQYFYEPFLEAFDPELRKQLGVWYTPPEVVEYMVARVDEVLRGELDLPDGLADPNVYVLDPCTGTGSYLVEVLRRIGRTLRENNGDALAGYDLKKAATERVFGFEILPAPFVVAHLQLGLLLQNEGASLSEERDERAGVYLTNALTGWEHSERAEERLPLRELEEERDAAEGVKREKPILVILGNPPYNAFAGVSPREEKGLVELYKEGLVSEWGIKKFNLDDLYVRFFRMAERRIAGMSGEGVICYVSNHSYLGDKSFVTMRQRFLEEFDGLWFDEMNGDSRETGKRTPDGRPDPSIFSTEYNREGIRVGTAIGLMVRKADREDEPTVRFRQFWGANKRAELLESLEAADFDAQYETTSPEKSNYVSFRPSLAAAHYLSWPKLTEISGTAPVNGLMEKRGGALIDVDRDALERRMKMYHDLAVGWEELAALGTGLTKNAAGFDARKTRNKVLNSRAYEPDNLCRYAIRPFETRWCYYSDVPPLWNRNRPDLWAQCWEGNSFLMSRVGADKDPEGSPFYFTRLLSDDHLLSPDASCFPLRLRDASSMGDAPPTANLSARARDCLSALGVGDPDSDAESAALIWHHALAVGYSPAYLEENADGIRRDWPRIPLPDSKDILLASAGLGRRMAALLDTEGGVPGVTSGVRPELRPVGVPSRKDGGSLNPDAGDLAVTAGWGYTDRRGAVMPKKGRAVARDYDAEELAAIAVVCWGGICGPGLPEPGLLDPHKYAQFSPKSSSFGPRLSTFFETNKAPIERGARELGLSVEEALLRLGESTRDIYLNDDAYWKNVPEKVWGYVIGGYQVIKKWLSYRETGVLGRPLSVDEAREVMRMARRIAALRLLEPALDENYEAVKRSSYAWPTG